MEEKYEDSDALEINVEDPEDLAFWAEQFELSEIALKEVVAKVGKSLDTITAYLQK